MPTRSREHQRVHVARAALAVAVVVLGACVSTGSDERGEQVDGFEARPAFATNDPVQRGCDLESRLLRRIRRGHRPGLSEELLVVPRQPNFIGTFDFTSHSGPWDYLQNIPLVLYGPGHIRSSGEPVRAAAQTVDVYPTVGELADAELPDRDGQVLDDALVEDTGPPPRLIVVVVWDGAGRNTLEQWPDRWPNLARLEREGTSYYDALVGSSPSVTSAVHSSLGTGAFPRAHLVTGNSVRGPTGELEAVFEGNDADHLKLTTFADEIDAAQGNEPVVGLLGWKNWHIGMMGHGSQRPGADADQLALLRYDDGVEVGGNEESYSTPALSEEVLGVEDEIALVDRADGEVDQRWLGHDIAVEEGRHSWDMYSNPAWAHFQADVALEMLRSGAYGTDDVTDFFFANFKMTDLAGHQWSINSPETAAVLEAQDQALGDIVEFLDQEVRDYVIVLTSDHGHSPSAASTGAWPIIQDELIADIEVEFDVPTDASLVQDSAAWGFYLDTELMDDLGVTVTQIAEFVNAYTIADNWPDEDLPQDYVGRAGEQVFSAAFPSADLGEITRCNAAEG